MIKKKENRSTKVIRKFFSHAFMIICSILAVFPLYWMIAGGTMTSLQVAQGRVIPGTALLENLDAIMERLDLWKCLYNSAVVSVAITFMSLLISSLAGYSFEIYKSKGKSIALKIVLAGMMIPSIATMIPLYKLVSSFGLINNKLGVILPAMTSIMVIFLFRQSTQSFPREVIEAARIDGMSEFGIFLKIYFPMNKSSYVTAFIITFMGAWNNYMWPRIIFLKNDMLTMPILVSNLLVGYTPNYGAVLLGCTMCTLPMLILFLCLQNAFMNGVAGSVKG